MRALLPNTKVILGGDANPANVVRAIRDRAYSYFHKPFAGQTVADLVQQAADGTREVSDNIHSVTHASNEAGVATGRLLDAANGLSSQSEQLKSEVDHFIGSLRAA